MRENGGELASWILDGAILYVCGDSRPMAGNVDQALREILQKHAGNSAERSLEYRRELLREGRYKRDVY